MNAPHYTYIAGLGPLLVKLQICIYQCWDTSVGKATKYWTESTLVDVYRTLFIHSGSFLAQCSEIHKVCSLVSEQILSQDRIQRTGEATATYTEIFSATDCCHLEGFLKKKNGYTNPTSHFVVMNKFYTVAPNNFGSLVCNKNNVILLAPRLLRWLLVFGNPPLLKQIKDFKSFGI
jgi:hypothetical protein